MPSTLQKVRSFSLSYLVIFLSFLYSVNNIRIQKANIAAENGENIMYETEKTGYLEEDFRLFHLKDQIKKEYSYHYHDFHKILIFLSGKVTYHIEGKAYHLKPWDMLLVSRGAIHMPEINFSVPYDRFILWIRKDIRCQELTSCFQKASDRSFSLIRLNSHLQEQLKDILYELEASLSGQKFGDALLKDALFTQFMVYINRIFLQKEYITDKKSYSADSQVEKLVRYINQNLEKDLSIDQLAGTFFLSRYHMMRKFKEETGYTIHSYITSKRLLLARSLISQGIPVMKASVQSGFRDYTTFVRAYKKQFGGPPTQE